MFLSELKKLNVHLFEEESIGREVANLQFLMNHTNYSNENYFINTHTTYTTITTHNNNNNNEEGEDEGQEGKIIKSNYYQIFNSEPQSKYFHLDAKTGIIRVARRIDRDQLCPLFKSCCTYFSNINYFNKNINLLNNNNNNEQLVNCQLDLNIRSDDQYTNIITVSVHIIDINDNSPIWLLNSKTGFLNFPNDIKNR
uniref:Cadherin_2 domain-containing protein n=1 Tax=Schistosoma mansoni TaxID=6183 RepID=A0A5K4F5A4_SCHMA